MINKILDKVLGLTILGDVAEWLNGRKTYLGLVNLALSAVIILVPVYFPELTALSSVALRIQELLTNLGVDIQTVNLAAAGVVGWGLSHKAVKRGKPENEDKIEAPEVVGAEKVV